MRHWSGKRYWIVGASEGLGREVARRISGTGAHVILSARNRDRLNDLSNQLHGPSEVLPFDVTDDVDVRRAAESAGRVDGLVYIAGIYWPLRAQDWDASRVTRMLDVNTTGAARVLGQVVPAMVAQGSGHVVLTGSLSGYRGLPGAIGYGASKAGLMVLAESMYADLRRIGIDVQLVNPGFIRTRLTDKNDFRMPFIMDPEKAARLYFEHMNGNRFALNFPWGFGALFRLGNFLPDGLYYRIFG
ncbi:SDR family NAD(P)-dependent oxidoreductase [Palleronia sp. LCG004]|uniref:SDR family NAD(P)-dependent oxidoreductase n=1 Tax=Palleronia sp. LCG004 TaxID=3079304 RepID=UPI0029420430|nr:SDR family NAD(P)-dependent oxidoreductase [Palleronia sp. LCG004]WOI55430.1 SDR family NAD(P)-dependent oxidoreductase [Palleronia sp. LCG004]